VTTAIDYPSGKLLRFLGETLPVHPSNTPFSLKFSLLRLPQGDNVILSGN